MGHPADRADHGATSACSATGGDLPASKIQAYRIAARNVRADQCSKQAANSEGHVARPDPPSETQSEAQMVSASYRDQ
jgi:hypothetical protein